MLTWGEEVIGYAVEEVKVGIVIERPPIPVPTSEGVCKCRVCGFEFRAWSFGDTFITPIFPHPPSIGHSKL